MIAFFRYDRCMERYFTFSAYCRQNFGRKLYRVCLDAGMTCPNRDGTLGSRGCIFCDEGGSGDFAISYHGQKLAPTDLIFNHQDAKEGDYIAYFQSYTNTYAPIAKLRSLFSSALADPLFAGISIGTRPDCLGRDVLALLEELKLEHPEKFIWCELGLQTIHEETAVWMRRGYALPVFDEVVHSLQRLDIPVIVHCILGFPQETETLAVQTMEHLNALKIDGIKLQLLQYLAGTDLGAMYQEDKEKFHVMSLEEYVHEIVQCIGHLNPSIAIHRLTGDGNGEILLAPLWSRDKKRVLNLIRHEMKKENIIQGSLEDKSNECICTEDQR